MFFHQVSEHNYMNSHSNRGSRYLKHGNFVMEIRLTLRNPESWLIQLNPLEANGTL